MAAEATAEIPQEMTFQRNDYFLKSVYNKYMVVSILAMLATSIAGMIDTAISGQFLGQDGLSAMSLVTPVYLIYYTVGAVIGMGGSIAANLAIGRNDYSGYRKIFTATCALTLLMCAVMTVLGLIFLEPLIGAFGEAGQVREYATTYLFWYIIGGSFTLLIYIPLNFLKVQGKPRASSALFVLSSAMNVILTWLFLSPVCGLGIGGAAIATDISMGVTAAIGFYILLKKTPDTRFEKPKKEDKAVRAILIYGSMNGSNNLLNALRIMLINSCITVFCLPVYLSSFAVVKSISDLMTGVVTGIASAMMPLVGVFYGEKDPKSIRLTFRRALITGGTITAVAIVLIIVLAQPICMLFNVSDPTAAEGTVAGLIGMALSYSFAFFSILLSIFFNSVKRPLLSNVILLLRLLIVMGLTAMLFAWLSGINGLWLSFIVTEALALGITLLIIIIIRKRHKNLDMLLLDTSTSDRGEISFSVKNDISDVMLASQRITDFCEENELDTKKTMRVSLSLEEMLTIIINHCMPKDKEAFIEIRIVKLPGKDDVLIRIRNTGKLFDPVSFYEENKDNEDMMDETLGMKVLSGTAKNIEFHETFGTNNLIISL